MLNYPLFHIDSEPQAVNTDGYDAEKEPFDVIAEKLTARSVKNNLMAVNGGVLCDPGLLQANSPRSCNTESKANNQALKNRNANQS